MPTVSEIERWRRLREQGRLRLFLREAVIGVSGAVIAVIAAAVWRGAPPGAGQILFFAAVGLLASALTAMREWNTLLDRLANLDIRGARCLRCGQVDPVHADWCPENEPARLGWFRRRA